MLNSLGARPALAQHIPDEMLRRVAQALRAADGLCSVTDLHTTLVEDRELLVDVLRDRIGANNGS